MQLSIIIVNYNVKYFLEHCLLSVQRACNGIDAEIIVVDNLSTDGSVEMVQSKFPGIVFIANNQNVGFAKANNQAVLIAKGKYILYLNPDTIVPEDCFEKCIKYLDAHEKVGGLGCRLIDGKGVFLPESKRGFPSALVAFFKISGLSTLFKKSTFFNKYHLGYLNEFEVNEVDVLVGCFMFCRKSVIDKVGSFDEDYFMYGEDIDLSYKISQAGYRNVYFPETTVIHYKGESTKKGSLNYVRMFYQAMIIFAQKHFKGSKQGAFVLLIRLAIYMRAILAFVTRMLTIVQMPLIDACLLLGSLTFMKMLWLKNVKVNTHYSSQLLFSFFGVYCLIWIISIYFSGGYDKPYKSTRVLRGMLIGGVITLILYGLLPEAVRFSRAITVLGALLGTLSILAWRKILYWSGSKDFEEESDAIQKVIVVGNHEDELVVKSLIEKAHLQKNIVGLISPFEYKEPYQLGVFSDLAPLSKVYEATEIIYVQDDLSFRQIIASLQACGRALNYKVHSRGTNSIIGSNSKDTAGDLYSTELIYRISTPSSIRNKRLVDIIFSIFFIFLSPILIWFVKNKAKYFLNHVLVLEGDKTYIGYHDEQFPKLKNHLMSVYPIIPNYYIPSDNQEHLNWLYAKNYSPWQDVKLIFAKWRSM